MRKMIATMLAALLTTSAYAADVAPPETPGSDAPKAAAEKKHLAKKHGLQPVKQPQAQMAGDAGAQAKAEAKHLKKTHGKINDSADKRLEKDHPNH